MKRHTLEPAPAKLQTCVTCDEEGHDLRYLCGGLYEHDRCKPGTVRWLESAATHERARTNAQSQELLNLYQQVKGSSL